MTPVRLPPLLSALLLLAALGAPAHALGTTGASGVSAARTAEAGKPDVRLAQAPSPVPFSLNPAGSPTTVVQGGGGGGQPFTMPEGTRQPSPPAAAPQRPNDASGDSGGSGGAAAPAPAPAPDTPFRMPGAPPPAPVTASGGGANAAPDAPATPDRYIIPSPRLTLEGEYDARAWTTYLTEDEAARQATFQLSYLNAVLVMPEVSRLRVTINGQVILETPIASANGPSHLSVPVRRGVLRAGPNLVRFEAVQRHRTDCGVPATYELWTEIDNATTGLTFQGGRLPLVGGLENLPAIGVDATGATNLRVITPAPLDPVGINRVMRAVQGLALRGRFPNPVVSLAANAYGPTPPGTVTMVLATSGELPKLMGAPPLEAQQRAIAGMVRDSRIEGPVLVVSGPNNQSVDTAIERLTTLAAPSGTVINTASFAAPDAPLFAGQRAVSLADLGVSTQEFSGRRLRVRFDIALPDDFYASVYGQAIFLLDAAFTAAVRPGSHVDLYVNGQIASNLPITSRTGGLFQRQPIKMPLHNFRPGLNRLWLEVVLDTEADRQCVPGATLPGDDRFVLFDSSQFTMADFARIGRSPDLAAFAATGFPYDRSRGDSVALVLARQDVPTVSAAGTLMSRLALSRGAMLDVETQLNTATLANRPAIFVGGIGQVATGVLGQVGIAETTRVSWLAGPADGGARAAGASAEYDDVLQRFRSRQRAEEATDKPGMADPFGNTNEPDTYERWRDNISGSGLQSLLNGFENWLQRTFDISYASLRVGETQQGLYEPPARTSVLMAQGNSPSGDQTWTLVAGRTPESLASGLGVLTQPALWGNVGGRAVAFQSGTGAIERQEIGTYRFIVTEPLGLANFRMVAANWLSINIVTYALMLVLCGTILGISTAFLLRRLGRTA